MFNFFFIFIFKDKEMTSKGERRCKYSIQRILKRSFYKARPDFLKNPETNRNLELDLYNDTLKIALEYNGIQHYKYTPRFHKSYLAFVRQQERDVLKRQLCKLNGVYLITVPWTVDDIHSFIFRKLSKLKELNESEKHTSQD